jgi:SNF2 family DNA or RNA helicase
MEEKGVRHVKYQGDMNRVQRDAAVRVFMSRDKAKVMLMSMKCGGLPFFIFLLWLVLI